MQVKYVKQFNTSITCGRQKYSIMLPLVHILSRIVHFSNYLFIRENQSNYLTLCFYNSKGYLVFSGTDFDKITDENTKEINNYISGGCHEKAHSANRSYRICLCQFSC